MRPGPRAPLQRAGNTSEAGAGVPAPRPYMATKTIIPTPGYALRALIKSGGYRTLIHSKGLDKDLDDLAAEARPSVAAELLQRIEDTALTLYASSVNGSWWAAGPNQHAILNEALLYAVGVGDKVAAERYWDKTFTLGLNRGPKRNLDEQEIRRISFGFESMFCPQKAKTRVPPPMEIRHREKAFHVGHKHLANPNQKVKFAEGRTRRTPLMQAISEGALDDVKELIAAGGDPNDCIPESGEGPLTYAMRRACDRKDTAIMDYLLGLDLLPQTVTSRWMSRCKPSAYSASFAGTRMYSLARGSKTWMCATVPSRSWRACHLPAVTALTACLITFSAMLCAFSMQSRPTAFENSHALPDAHPSQRLRD